MPDPKERRRIVQDAIDHDHRLVADLRAALVEAEQQRDEATKLVDRATRMIEHYYEAQPVEQERDGTYGGFKSRLEHHIHEMYKREPKVARLRAALEQIRAIASQIEDNGATDIIDVIDAVLAETAPPSQEPT